MKISSVLLCLLCDVDLTNRNMGRKAKGEEKRCSLSEDVTQQIIKPGRDETEERIESYKTTF